MKPVKTKQNTLGKYSLLILTIGLAISLLFVTASVIFATTEISRINGQIITLLSGGEQVTYQIGQLGRQLTRLQLLVRESIDADPNRRAQINQEIVQVNAELTDLTHTIPPLLHPAEQDDWNSIYMHFEMLRADYARVLALIKAGNPVAGHNLLDQSSIHSQGLFDSLRDLSQKNRNTMNIIVEETKQRHSFIWIIETATGIGLGAGILLVWLIVIRIIQQQRHRIDQFIAELEIVNHDLDSFAGRIAHEIKNLLAPIPFVIENLKRSLDKPERIMDLIGKLDNFTQRAASIVDGLLIFSKSSHAVSSGEKTSIASEIRSTVEELRELAEHIGATIDATKVYNFQLTCAPALIHIVVRNLLDNALKFLAGRPTRSVQITSYLENKEWGVLVIADTGPGIPPEDAAKIFEPFYRVPGSNVPGTGIGLATVNRIVHSCGGSIEVDSELGKGTKFIICFPLV
jgi:signal transduction histidine kinase